MKINVINALKSALKELNYPSDKVILQNTKNPEHIPANDIEIRAMSKWPFKREIIKNDNEIIIEALAANPSRPSNQLKALTNPTIHRRLNIYENISFNSKTLIGKPIKDKSKTNWWIQIPFEIIQKAKEDWIKSLVIGLRVNKSSIRPVI